MAVLTGLYETCTLVASGGYRKVEHSDWRSGDIFIDLSLIDHYPTIQAKATFFESQPLELKCHEAGENLTQEGFVNSETNG